MASNSLPSRPTGKIASLYYNLSIDREQYLSRARDCSKLTIPMLLPPEGTTRSFRFMTPYQSVGARAVNHLASKLLLALFPPGSPFFRLVIDDFQLEELTQSKDARGIVEKGLAKVERSVSSAVETSALRVPAHLGFKHLIVGGNITLYVDPKTGKGRAIPLTNYVVRRDPMGNVLDIIVMEEVDPETLPEAVKAALKAAKGDGGMMAEEEVKDLPSRKGGPYEKTTAIFTHIYRKGSRMVVCQEVDGIEIESAKGSYEIDKCPWLPLRMVVVDGESYGRGLVEEYYGDLNSLEKLTKALVQFSAAAAKIIFLVKPNATTKAKALAKAESGDFVQGQKEDIDVLQLEKYNDFQVVKSTADEIAQRLSMAFLMNSAVQRNAERVTAEEIRLMAQELDAGFGGIYATLSQELQLPLVNILMAQKTRMGQLPKLPSGFVKPAVVTGVEALGRAGDFQNLNLALQAVMPFPKVAERLNEGELIERLFSSANVNPDGLFKSDEEIAQEQAEAQLMAMAQSAAPGAARAAIQASTSEPPQPAAAEQGTPVQ